ncbi:hypothetical protein [Gorillibacterium sp. CAU 1737]|uniref:hypothetical protein n=1 Tax=Gorillibacterium sp. CAU 1737 TaxID=3140362 RepID=UPI0032607FFC
MRISTALAHLKEKSSLGKSFAYIALGLLLLGLILWTILKPGEPEIDLPTQYTYETFQATNGLVLHALITDPENIRLEAIEQNLLDLPRYGMNGGFFYESSLLSIAVNDGQPVIGKPGGYGSGWSNVKYARGTLVWDRESKKFSVQVVTSADKLTVTQPERYWAQGGISMNLQAGESWHTLAEAEHMPGIDNLHMRTGLVYTKDGQLQLLVTNDLCTAGDFRAAVLEWGGETFVDGIFLDGDGSSQLKAKEVELAGDRRLVRQMIRLIR